MALETTLTILIWMMSKWESPVLICVPSEATFTAPAVGQMSIL